MKHLRLIFLISWSFLGLFSSIEVFAQDDNTVYTMVEQQPVGLEQFFKYVQQNMVYPGSAQSQSIQGRVLIEFIIEKDGSVSNLKLVKGIGGGCDEEAMRLVQNAPRWVAGKQNGKAVRVKMLLPILFKLG